MEIELGDFASLAPPELADLVLTDPPYNIGADYGIVNDRLKDEDYLDMMRLFAAWSDANTADDAHLFVIHYPDFFFKHGQRIFCEEEAWTYRRSIRWCYPSNIGHSSNSWTRSSRDIAWFTKGTPHFDAKADPEPYKNPTDKRVRKLIEAGSPGRAPYDWWEYDLQKNVSHGYQGYANQIPQPLLQRIIKCTTLPGQLVIDPFCGTGSTLKAAETLGRQAWGCDANPEAPCFKVNT